MKDVPEEYKKRRGIENNFKSIEQIRARTGSQNHSIRVFMFSLSGRVQSAVYDSTKNERGDREQAGAACQKNMPADVFSVLLMVLVKRIRKSADRESKYYLQRVQ